MMVHRNWDDPPEPMTPILLLLGVILLILLFQSALGKKWFILGFELSAILQITRATMNYHVEFV